MFVFDSHQLNISRANSEFDVARVFCLRHAAAWIRDLNPTEMGETSDGDLDLIKYEESLNVANRIDAMADKLEAKR